MAPPESRCAQGNALHWFAGAMFDVGSARMGVEFDVSMYSSRSCENACVNSCAWPTPNAAPIRCDELAGFASVVVRPLTDARPRIGSKMRNEATWFLARPDPPE